MARKKIRERMGLRQIVAAEQFAALLQARVLLLLGRRAPWKATAQADWRREQTGEPGKEPQTQHERELKTRRAKFKEQSSLPLCRFRCVTSDVAMRGQRSYPCAMPSVGQQLRQAREAQKMDLHEIVDITKIRADHLRALEEGNYSVFSAPVYIRGFVRSYATLLKLDTAQILEELGHELADSGQVDPSLAPSSRSLLDSAMFQLSKFSRRMVWPAVGIGAVLLVVLGCYLVWSHNRNQDPTVGLGEGLYQVPANSGDTLPLPASR